MFENVSQDKTPILGGNKKPLPLPSPIFSELQSFYFDKKQEKCEQKSGMQTIINS